MEEENSMKSAYITPCKSTDDDENCKLNTTSSSNPNQKFGPSMLNSVNDCTNCGELDVYSRWLSTNGRHEIVKDSKDRNENGTTVVGRSDGGPMDGGTNKGWDSNSALYVSGGGNEGSADQDEMDDNSIVPLDGDIPGSTTNFPIAFEKAMPLASNHSQASSIESLLNTIIRAYSTSSACTIPQPTNVNSTSVTSNDAEPTMSTFSSLCSSLSVLMSSFPPSTGVQNAELSSRRVSTTLSVTSTCFQNELIASSQVMSEYSSKSPNSTDSSVNISSSHSFLTASTNKGDLPSTSSTCPKNSTNDNGDRMDAYTFCRSLISCLTKSILANDDSSTQQETSIGNFDLEMLQGFFKDMTLNSKAGAARHVESSLSDHNRINDSDVKVTVEQCDSSSVLVSARNWSDLCLEEDLLKGIYNKGFNKPSKIQEIALPLVINSENNLIGQAQSGSGKTATFALAMLSKINRINKFPQAMCLCPTRELAVQNMSVIQELGRFTSITYFLAVPLCGKYDCFVGAQIFVGTPGKTMEILKKRQIPLQHMKMFVLDEADQMIDRKNNMGPQVEQISSFFPQKLQILLFSATFADDVREFATKFVPRAYKIFVNKEELTVNCISQFYIQCANVEEKFSILSDLYGSLTIGQSVIFVNSRKCAFELCERMKGEGHTVSLICGTQTTGAEYMDHDVRDRVMNEFRTGTTKVLICTDLLSRGIDVPQVTLVINYDLPVITGKIIRSSSTINMESYLHRIGRTGRFGLKGVAINLVLTYEIPLLEEIRQFYRCTIRELSKDPEELEGIIKKLRI